MEVVMQNETIRCFIDNFHFADQTHIIQDLIIIGIQTVLTNLKGSSTNTLRDSLDQKDLHTDTVVSEIAQIKQEICKINHQLGKDSTHQAVKSLLLKQPKNTVRIVSHQEKQERRSPKKEVTGKVTDVFPDGDTHLVKSKEHFRHHLDDSEMKQTFTYYEPPTSYPRPLTNKIPAEKDKPAEKQKPSNPHMMQNVSEVANVQDGVQLKQKYRHSPERPSKEKVNQKAENINKRQTKNAPISYKPPKPTKPVQSKIKDLVDFDKMNSRSGYFNQNSASDKKLPPPPQQSNQNFKKVKQQIHREEEKSEDSEDISRDEFSPFKKDSKQEPKMGPWMQNRRPKYDLREYDDITSELSSSLPQMQSMKDDSQFSIYQGEMGVTHKCPQVQGSDSCSSYSGVQSSNSSRFPHKAVGKISSRKR